MAATNYAIEGVTGDWSALVCAKTDYELSFDTAVRAKAMKTASPKLQRVATAAIGACHPPPNAR